MAPAPHNPDSRRHGPQLYAGPSCISPPPCFTRRAAPFEFFSGVEIESQAAKRPDFLALQSRNIPRPQFELEQFPECWMHAAIPGFPLLPCSQRCMYQLACFGLCKSGFHSRLDDFVRGGISGRIVPSSVRMVRHSWPPYGCKSERQHMRKPAPLPAAREIRRINIHPAEGKSLRSDPLR